jgi:hypothetical protein
VEISGMDKLFAAFGVEKKLDPVLKFEKHTNGKLNRFIRHQFQRIDKCASTNPLKAWRIGMHLIRKSNIFFVMGLNHVFPN